MSAQVLQLTIYGLVNCYLVMEADGLTLVDAVLGGQADAILSAAAATGLPLRRILLTHAHVDHIGSLDALSGRHPSIEVAISEREAPLLRGDKTLLPGEPQSKVRGGYPGAATRPHRLLQDGQRYGSLLCLATPGHTPGHLSFLEERSGTLLTGDALLTVGGALHLTTDPPWYFPFPAMATWDSETAHASAERLLHSAEAAAIRCFAPGHGPVVQGGARELAVALAHASPGRRAARG